MGLAKGEVDCEDRIDKKGWTQHAHEAHPWKEFEQLETYVSHSNTTYEVSHLVVNQHG